MPEILPPLENQPPAARPAPLERGCGFYHSRELDFAAPGTVAPAPRLPPRDKLEQAARRVLALCAVEVKGVWYGHDETLGPDAEVVAGLVAVLQETLKG